MDDQNLSNQKASDNPSSSGEQQQTPQQITPTNNERSVQGKSMAELFDNIFKLLEATAFVLWMAHDFFRDVHNYFKIGALTFGIAGLVYLLAHKILARRSWIILCWIAYSVFSCWIIKISVTITAENIVTGWLPPLLSPDCSNVVFSFAGKQLELPLEALQLPPVDRSDLDTNKGTRLGHTDGNQWIYDLKGSQAAFRSVNWTLNIFSTQGSATFDAPVIPFIKDNRVYVCAELPLTNAKRTILMGDDWDDKIPASWDRNYSSNAFEIVREDGLPVLQVIYERSNKVQVNGVFLVNKYDLFAIFGSYSEFFPMKALLSMSDGVVLTTEVEEVLIHTKFAIPITNTVQKTNFTNQKPIFKYPSWKYRGEYAN